MSAMVGSCTTWSGLQPKGTSRGRANRISHFVNIRPWCAVCPAVRVSRAQRRNSHLRHQARTLTRQCGGGSSLLRVGLGSIPRCRAPDDVECPFEFPADHVPLCELVPCRSRLLHHMEIPARQRTNKQNAYQRRLYGLPDAGGSELQIHSTMATQLILWHLRVAAISGSSLHVLALPSEILP